MALDKEGETIDVEIPLKLTTSDVEKPESRRSRRLSDAAAATAAGVARNARAVASGR
jgi:hypothetical protein